MVDSNPSQNGRIATTKERYTGGEENPIYWSSPGSFQMSFNESTMDECSSTRYHEHQHEPLSTKLQDWKRSMEDRKTLKSINKSSVLDDARKSIEQFYQVLNA